MVRTDSTAARRRFGELYIHILEAKTVVYKTMTANRCSESKANDTMTTVQAIQGNEAVGNDTVSQRRKAMVIRHTLGWDLAS